MRSKAAFQMSTSETCLTTARDSVHSCNDRFERVRTSLIAQWLYYCFRSLSEGQVQLRGHSLILQCTCESARRVQRG